MDYKVKLTKCKNEKHHGGVFDTLTKWAKPRPTGPKGRPASPTPWPGDQSLSWLGPTLDTSLRRFTRKDLRLEGGGGQEESSAGQVDGRSAVHLLQTNLAKLVETPLCLYISPLRLKTE
jgi:hypothetical protein